jgi:hypothetical protein
MTDNLADDMRRGAKVQQERDARVAEIMLMPTSA